jgi:hypothetical protein
MIPLSPEIQEIITSAQRLGVQIDEKAAGEWLDAIRQLQSESILVDRKSGTFGHRISMLDFSTAELAHFRRLGKLVGFADRPGVVQTALALSGSAAQSKIQTYPGDADFFERVHITAPTREEAGRILGELLREKALATRKGSTHQLMEVKFGEYPCDVLREGKLLRAGTPVSWSAEEIEAGQVACARAGDASPLAFTWQEACQNSGWVKLDWIVADPAHHRLVNASNMLDVTWEAPDGSITPLDGYLDPYFQEVYLDAEDIPLFTRLKQHVSGDALDEYIRQLQIEVKKYLTKDVNYGKAAKRMYNIFRLTGRYQEAAYLRELFDEPATVLYQVWAFIRTMDECCRPGASIPITHVLAQADELILTVVDLLEGEQEKEIVRLLLRLRDLLTRQNAGTELSPQAEAARAEVINLVNNFYYEKMSGFAPIREYMEAINADKA